MKENLIGCLNKERERYWSKEELDGLRPQGSWLWPRIGGFGIKNQIIA